MEKYDLIIVGGGPIGLACAIEAKKNNLSYLILEKGALTNSLYHYPLFMTFFSTAEKLEIGEIPFNCVAPKPGRQEALDYYRNVQRYFDLNVHLYEEVISISGDKFSGFEVVSSKKINYKSKNIIVATGFYDEAVMLNVPGETLPKVHHYFKEGHPYINQKIVVVGSNNSSVDAALECWRKGADVTMVIRQSQFNHRLKYWVRPDIENRIKEGSIKAYFDSKILNISEKEVEIITPDGVEYVENDFVLAMTGYMPNFKFLENAGIDFDGIDKVPKYNSVTMETNVSGLYLAGVVCGGMNTHIWFIENSRIHAQIIVEDIIKNN